MRLEYGWDKADPKANSAIALRVSPNRTWMEFERVVAFPGGQCKFTLRWDEPTGNFLALTTNATHPKTCPSARNVLTLATSPSLLEGWGVADVVLKEDQGFSLSDSPR